jgi:hypothetical protein
MKEFYIHGGLAGCQGPRVFLHENTVRDFLQGTYCSLDQLPHGATHPVAKLLREVAIWGGADKVYQGSDGSWYGYELSCRPEQGERDLFQVRETLASEGFTELHICPWA